MRFLPNLIFYSYFFFFLIGCQTLERPVVDFETAVERTQSLVVMGVHYIDEYNDAFLEDEIKFDYSSGLLKDAENVSKLRRVKGKPLLTRPLHPYLSNFRLTFGNLQEGDDQWLVRYNKDLRGYEPYTVHAFYPGKYKLNLFKMDQYRFKWGDGEKVHVRFFKYPEKFFADFGQWELESGKIYYLGDVTFHFKTERFSHGFLPREQVVQKIKLTRVSFRDEFQKTQEFLIQEKPWFTDAAKAMVNVSFEQDWSGLEGDLKKVPLNFFQEIDANREKEKEEKEKEEQQKQEELKNRDKDKFFF